MEFPVAGVRSLAFSIYLVDSFDWFLSLLALPGIGLAVDFRFDFRVYLPLFPNESCFV